MVTKGMNEVGRMNPGSEEISWIVLNSHQTHLSIIFTYISLQKKRNSSCSTNKAEIKYTPLTPCPVSFHTTIIAGVIYGCDSKASRRG